MMNVSIKNVVDAIFTAISADSDVPDRGTPKKGKAEGAEGVCFRFSQKLKINAKKLIFGSIFCLNGSFNRAG